MSYDSFAFHKDIKLNSSPKGDDLITPSAKLGSESFARWHEHGWDSQADQQSIREGYFYTVGNSNSVPGIFIDLPLGGWEDDPRRQ